MTSALAIVVPTLAVRFAPPVVAHPRHGRVVLPPRRVVPPAELPPVEPVSLVDLSPDEARAFNADVPFADGPNPAARPFTFAGQVEDRARATDCLAAAVIYEAGDDAVGEKAVAQVILNRLRHPAFPKTVCGVVFEGANRATGCQFTFTCDGALTRWTPTAAGWARAQGIAAAALNGAVYRPVGYATHYHTDWVVPYWQSSLDKIARVGTHLFFRWTGWWGTPPAFNRRPTGIEPVVAALAPITGVTPGGLTLDPATLAPPAGAEEFAPVAGDANSFLVTLPVTFPPELYPALAGHVCGERAQCKFSGWTDKARTPTALPLGAQQIAAMTFAYLRDRPAGLERTLWNCAQVPRPDRTQCMKVQVYQPAPTPTPTTSPTPGGPAELDGVRRRAVTPPGTSPAPAPSPTPPRPRSDGAATPSPAAAAPRRSAPSPASPPGTPGHPPPPR